MIADIEGSAENVVETLIDEDLTVEKVAARSLDPQTCRNEEIWFIILQSDEVNSPLRAVLQKHQNDLQKSLRVIKYLCSAGMRTVASSASGKFGAVKADSRLQKLGKSASSNISV